MHDAFAVIRWNAAGIAPATAGLLRVGVGGPEAIVFFVLGPILVDRLGPARARALAAAAAAAVRWSVMALTRALRVCALADESGGLRGLGPRAQ